MRDLITRWILLSGIDPVYFITGIVDILALYLLGRLKKGLTVHQRALYKAVIVVAILLTAGVLSKVFGLITEWKDLKTLWDTYASL